MIRIDELEQLLLTVGVEKEIHNKIIEEAQLLEEEKKSEKEAIQKKSKGQLVVVVKGAPQDAEIVSHVFQIPQEDDPITLMDKIKRSAIEHNLASKRKKNLVTTFDDVPHIKRKFRKNENYQLKTKEDWVRTIVLTPPMEQIAEKIKVDKTSR